CSVNGTGVPGSGIAICDAAATAAAKPTIPMSERREARGEKRESVVVVMSVGSRDAEGNRVAAAEAERGEAAVHVAVLHGIEKRRQHARAARADRMAERDGAAVHIHVVPVPA